MTNARVSACLLFLLVLLSACAGPIQRAEEYTGQDEWMKAVIEYRKALNKDPGDIEIKSRLKQTELKAADHYYQRGLHLVEQDNLDAGILQFQQGLAAMPDHNKLLQAMNLALARKEANALFVESKQLEEAGSKADALRLYRRALDIYPEHVGAKEAIARLERETEQAQEDEEFALSSKSPITLNFRQTDLKTAFEFIAKSFGVNVIFDEGVRSVPVTLFAKDVTFQQALGLMLSTTKTFYKRIGPNTVLIAPDTKEKRGQYEDHIVRSFQLTNIRAKDMADILKALITIRKIIFNEQLNTIVIRDTESIMALAEKLIAMNDRKPAEMILDVEILEVNRTKAERLGLDLGTYRVTAAVPTITGGAIREAIRGTSTITLPSAAFNLYKQDVDAKTLANPKIRVVNGKAAKIHIGDRVPLRVSTITDATGQVRTTFDYKEIGIRLLVEPTVHLDNSTMVKLGLEVSSLGENLGTATEQAFRIGTRNAETVMLLRDGETAILGGLIRDEERSTRVRVPFIGDIPIVGSLFTSYDNSAGRTDVLLTITPRVVRGWESPAPDMRQFYSGTSDNYSTEPLFATLDAGAKVSLEAPKSDVAQLGPTQDSQTPAGPAPAQLTSGAERRVELPTVFSFAEPVYDVNSNQDFELQLMVDNLGGASVLPLEILYNPQLLKYVEGEAGDFTASDFSVEADAAQGVLRVRLTLADPSTATGNGVLARLRMQGVKPGVSYLVYRAPVLNRATGETINAQVRAARVVVK